MKNMVQFVAVNGIPGVLFPGPCDMVKYPEILADFPQAYDLADESGSGKPTVAVSVPPEEDGEYRIPDGYMGTVILKESLSRYAMNVSIVSFETTDKIDLGAIRERVRKLGKAKSAPPAPEAIKKPAPLTPFQVIESAVNAGLQTLCEEIGHIDFSDEQGTFCGERMESGKFQDAMNGLLVSVFSTVRFVAPYPAIVAVSDAALRAISDEIAGINVVGKTFKGEKMGSLKMKEALTETFVAAFATIRFAASMTLEPEIEL